MSFKLIFVESAWREWQKLDGNIKTQFKKKLMQRLIEPHVPASALSGMKSCYKIKLRDKGYRLVYQVHDQNITVCVIAVGRRDKNLVYRKAQDILKSR
ncbi:type II toxin-antitoxin system RelE/ParE family toxin [Neisseriaceae bacterium ESL0693]|nr:type II toxin-antitoxin system RelE/ParE family toxin [Neisseriaceae bacterium ESL0693]